MDNIRHLITLPLIQIAMIRGDNRRNTARGEFLCREATPRRSSGVELTTYNAARFLSRIFGLNHTAEKEGSCRES